MSVSICLEKGKGTKNQTEVCLECRESSNSLLPVENIKLTRNCSCKNEVRPLIEEADKLYHRLFNTSYSRILPFVYGVTCIIGIGIPFTIKYFMDKKRLRDLESKVINCVELVCPVINPSSMTGHQYEYIKRDVKFPIDPKDQGEHTLEYLVYSKALKKNADAIMINYGNTAPEVSSSLYAKDFSNIYVSYIRLIA
jgi:hypothetical protein